MTKVAQLAQSFKEAAARFGPAAFHDAEVTAIDVDNYLCDVLLEGEVEIFDVRLRAIVSSNKSIDVLPKVGAQIVVGKLDDDDYIMVACDEMTSYRLTIGTTVFTMDDSGVQIKKGAETLNKILNDLVTGLLSVAAPKDVPGITLLKTRINNLLK